MVRIILEMKIIRVEARDLCIFLTCTSCGLYFFSPHIFSVKGLRSQLGTRNSELKLALTLVAIVL